MASGSIKRQSPHPGGGESRRDPIFSFCSVAAFQEILLFLLPAEFDVPFSIKQLVSRKWKFASDSAVGSVNGSLGKELFQLFSVVP